MVVDNDSDRRNSQRIVFAAASVLADWPNNFFRLLREITEEMPTDSSTGVARGRLSGIYRSLFSLRGILPTVQGDFLRIAFLGFVRDDWKPAFIDQKLMRRLGTGQSERFISRAAFARRYGIDTRTAARFLEDQGVPSRIFRWGKSERKLIDSAAATLFPTFRGKIYRLRQAAAMIGISSGLLKHLKASGDFQVHHQLRTKPGFHELDIEAFIQKLKMLAPPINPADPSSPKYVPFAIVARGWYGSVEAKANIVQAVLSRELPVVGNIDGTVAGLLVSYEGFQRLAHDERARANENTRIIAEAASQLECNTRSVRRLVELEWLRARPTPKAFRVTEESIAEFKKRYVSLLSIARTTNSASWALQNLCKRRNLSMLVARQPGTEEQPGVHSRGAAARAALLAIGQKGEVAIRIASFAVLIYGCDIVVKLSSAAWRARNALSSSSPSFSAQPATIRIPCSTSIWRNSGSGVEAAMSPRARSNRKLTATSVFEYMRICSKAASSRRSKWIHPMLARTMPGGS